MLITFSTPALQAAIQRARKLPIVFTQVADPVVAGAGRSDTDHLPNLTGVYLISAYDRMMPLIHDYLPGARVLGTVYVPAEVNMVAQLEVMRKAVAAAGMELKAVAANSPSEVGEAALTLAASHVDAICQLPGNLTAAAFPSIARVSQQAKLPVFVFQSSQLRGGAVAAMARDYYDSGREAAHMAARVMRGESPASIPLVGFSKTKLIVNLTAATGIGLNTPAQVTAKADEVVGR
jgi:putative tryptophan/tyrosine transport system substrate-binding protein